MIPCEMCSSLCTIPIVYGYPDSDLERAASRGLVEIGGCVLAGIVPNRRCLDCSHSWKINTVFDVESFLFDAVLNVQKFRDGMSHSVTRYGSACIEYGRVLQRGEQADSAYAQMLTAHDFIGRSWERFFVRAQEFCRRFYPDSDGRTYGDFQG